MKRYVNVDSLVDMNGLDSVFNRDAASLLFKSLSEATSPKTAATSFMKLYHDDFPNLSILL